MPVQIEQYNNIEIANGESMAYFSV